MTKKVFLFSVWVVLTLLLPQISDCRKRGKYNHRRRFKKKSKHGKFKSKNIHSKAYLHAKIAKRVRTLNDSKNYFTTNIHGAISSEIDEDLSPKCVKCYSKVTTKLETSELENQEVNPLTASDILLDNRENTWIAFNVTHFKVLSYVAMANKQSEQASKVNVNTRSIISTRTSPRIFITCMRSKQSRPELNRSKPATQILGTSAGQSKAFLLSTLRFNQRK